MPRNCDFTVEVKKVEELRSCLEEVAQQHVPGRWRPRIDEDWTDVWVSARHCLDMAQSRAYELNLFSEEESLAKLKRLLLVATFGVRSSTLDVAGNMQVLCRTEDYEPEEWSKFQQRVGSYHADDELRATAIDLGHLRSCLSKDEWREEVLWINLAVTHLEYMYFEARRSS